MSKTVGTRKVCSNPLPSMLLYSYIEFQANIFAGGEQCLNSVKSEKSLVDARNGSDVQLDRQIWVVTGAKD